MLLCIFFSLFALGVCVILLTDNEKDSCYSLLFMLPLGFSVLSILFYKIYDSVPQNLGVTLILILFFVRTVISPLFMRLGNYSVTITQGFKENTANAILLVLYEMFCVFFVLYIKVLNMKNKTNNSNQHCNATNPHGIKLYSVIVLLLVALLLICNMITPALLGNYRTIFDISDEFFTNYEDSYTIDKYGTTFITKLSLVVGQYLTRALLLLVPACLILYFSQRKTKLSKILSLLSCTIPLFFIGGAIARSLIYVICLLLLHNYLFGTQGSSLKPFLLIGLGGIIVIAWWIFRSSDESIFEQLSRRFSSYFSGVNIVSGAFNLPDEIEYKIRYFVYDFIGSVPFGTTLFNITEQRIQPFFNLYNLSSGQIPTTIGMGYYYFGPILAPIYSMIFAETAATAGAELCNPVQKHPLRRIRLLYTVFAFSMGIVMYNIEITMTIFFSIIFPMYILEQISQNRQVKL